MQNEPCLTRIDSPKTTVFSLASGGTTIGRDPANAVCVPKDEGLSRFHARIRHRLGVFWLEDLGSTNGTYIALPGGKELRVQPGKALVLMEGGEIRVGFSARFKTSGLLPGTDDPGRETILAIQRRISNGYAQAGSLTGEYFEDTRAAIEDFATRLAQAGDLQTLAALAGETDHRLSQTVFGKADPADLGAFGKALPPLDDDLPSPDAPHPITVRGTVLPGMQKPSPDKEEADRRG